MTVLEFLSYKEITETDKDLFFEFLKNTAVIDLRADDSDLIKTITSIRKAFNIKLPDAIIAASAIINQGILITNDTRFSKITSLQILTY